MGKRINLLTGFVLRYDHKFATCVMPLDPGDGDGGGDERGRFLELGMSLGTSDSG